MDKRLPYLVDNPQHKGFIWCDSHGPKCQVPIKSRKNNGPQVPSLIKLHNVPKVLVGPFWSYNTKGSSRTREKKGRMHVHVLEIEDKKQFITLMSYISSRLMFPFRVIFLAKQNYLYHLATMVESYVFLWYGFWNILTTIGWTFKYARIFKLNDLKPYKGVVSFTH